jgi:hypothetical protein
MPRRSKEPPPPVRYVTRESYKGQGLSPYHDDEYTLTPEGERQRAAEEEARERLERMELERAADAAGRELDAMWPLPESDDERYQAAAVHVELARRAQMREIEAAEASLSRDPKDWLRGPRMTQTEASLRFALHLVREGHATADVELYLTSRELTRAGRRPRFPVEAFLEGHGVRRIRNRRRGGDTDWRARYAVHESPVGLRLSDERGQCDVLAPVAGDSRVIAYVGSGTTAPTRASAEHVALRTLIGRALTREDVRPLDLLAVVVPRSTRTRKLAKALRSAPRVMQAGLSVCTVDRTGFVDGLPFPAAYAPGGEE